MEKSQSYGGLRWITCSLLVVCHMFSSTQAADGVIKKFKDPAGNVNLSPNQQWYNAYLCTQNISSVCSPKYTLTGAGWYNVTSNDGAEYCENGCAQHTMAVLTCISTVKHDYKFENKAIVQDIEDTITEGCKSGFNGIGKISSSAGNIHQTIPIVFSALVAYLLIGNM